MQVLMALAYHFTGHDMGLRDEIQADIAEAFNNDLADAVHTFTCERISKLIGILKLKLLLRLKKTILVVAFCLAHTVNMRFKRLEYWPPIRKLPCFKMKCP